MPGGGGGFTLIIQPKTVLVTTEYLEAFVCTLSLNIHTCVTTSHDTSSDILIIPFALITAFNFIS